MMRFKDFINTDNHIIVKNRIFPKGENYPEYLAIYENEINAKAIDRYFLKKYGSKIIDIDLVGNTSADTVANIHDNIAEWLMINDVKIRHIWDNYNKKYDSISNYDRNEVSKDIIGARKQTDIIGEVTNKEDLDNATSTDTNSVVPFNESEFTNVDRTTSNVTGHGEGGRIANQSTVLEHENTTTNDKAVDTHESRVTGNIGVQHSAQMLEMDNNLWMQFEFYEWLFDSIIKECTVGMWG